ncbi:MAG: uroporphyrinogen-III C-methyltransferase [Candidatus Omnitrophica bacterium]|nr:uroporphyrinogen-III C-methyltransferase [Candidatus Omnitrophota bacterium]
MKRGRVYLVGAGPGDPGLITVRGQELLRQADVVYYDHLVSPRLLQICPPAVKLAYIGKEADHHTASQSTINARLIREAKSGKAVVRLKGGDPLLFGRGAEEALELARAGIAFEIVPGVTSALAVPAYAGIPVTYRTLSSSVAIVTGHEDPSKPGTSIRWNELATACDTLVFLMGVATLPATTQRLIRHGRKPSTPCAVIEWGTCPNQRTVTGTLRTIAREAKRAGIKPPAVLVIGDVVSLRARLNWFERRPLFGRRILVTRASDKAGALAAPLEALGAEVEQLPAIELAPVKANGVFREAVHAMPDTDWVFFTSPEGIGWFTRMLKPYRKDLRWLSGCHIGAIGPKTAMAVEESGLHVDFVPKRFSQEGMVQELPRRVLRGKRALILSAAESRDVLSAGLRKQGMRVAKVPIYQTVIPKALVRGITHVIQRPFDAVTVTSASCVDHLHDALRTTGHAARFRQWPFASIGPVTSRAVRERGGRVAIEAKASTVEGLVEALVRRLARTRR